MQFEQLKLWKYTKLMGNTARHLYIFHCLENTKNLSTFNPQINDLNQMFALESFNLGFSVV